MTRFINTVRNPKHSASAFINGTQTNLTEAVNFKNVDFMELTPMSESPGTYRCFVILAAPAQAVSSYSPMNKHNYTQANRNKTEVILWTRVCQAEKTKCAHIDRKWHLRDKNLFCVSSAAKKKSEKNLAFGQSKLQTFSSV